MDIYIGVKDRMYELFENISNKDFIWIQCYDEYEKREVVQAFINKGYISKLEEIDYEGLPHLIVNLKSKLIYHCGPSMAITLKNNGVKWYEGDEFIERKIC